MDKSKKLSLAALAIAVVALGLSLYIMLSSNVGGAGEALGAVTPVEEKYNPNMKRNGKFITALPIETSSTLKATGNITFDTTTFFLNASTDKIGVGTTSPATLMDLYTTATSTMTIDSNSTSKGGCIRLKDFDGSGYTYIVGANGTLTASTNSCL